MLGSAQGGQHIWNVGILCSNLYVVYVLMQISCTALGSWIHKEPPFFYN